MTTSVDLRIAQYSLEDPEGITLKIFEDTKAIPSEYEIIKFENERYQVMEGGIIWATHVPNRLRVTVFVTPMDSVPKEPVMEPEKKVPAK